MKNWVVHCKKDPFDVLIDRTTKWGNPFKMEEETERDESVQKHKEWLMTQPKLLNDLHELRNKVLGCWCAPKACHGDILSYLTLDTPDKIKLIIAGSRSFRDYPLLEEESLKVVKGFKDVIIISGMAKGADKLGVYFAKKHGFTYIPMEAIWKDEEGNFRKVAGYERNENMIKLADQAIFFWDGESKGTLDCIRRAKREEIPYKVIIASK